MRRKHRAFTLIEVLVALGIAAGALMLLLSANRAALRRTLRAQQQIEINELIESKTSEIRSGIENAPSGQFESSGWSWKASRTPARIEGLQSVEEVSLAIFAPGHAGAVRTVVFLVTTPKEARK